MTRSLFSVYFLATLWMHIWTVAGSLYPTKPVASTIYTAGSPADVTWIEDGKTPLLNVTGTLKIDLYAGRNKYLATLATEVDPLSLSTTVFIPTTFPTTYHHYTLHFITVHPHQLIYTANFNIIPSPFLRSNTSYSISTLSSSTGVASTSTTLSRIVGTSSIPPSATRVSSAGVGIGWKRALKAQTPEVALTLNMENIWFRLMFLFWPALVGLIMSL